MQKPRKHNTVYNKHCNRHIHKINETKIDKYININNICAPTHTPQHTHTLLHTQSYLKKYLAQGHAGKPYMIWSQALDEILSCDDNVNHRVCHVYRIFISSG